MNQDIKNAILNGNLILFLGAGASKSSTDKSGAPLLDGHNLAKHLATSAGLEFNDEALDTTYSAAKSKLGSRLNSILENCFRFTIPSQSYISLACIPWRRIYTLNIDDALEQAIRQAKKQQLKTYISKDRLEDQDRFFETLNLVKLNGSIERLDDGLIFSSSEYANATASQLPWYEEVATEFTSCMFLFIGTKLNESLFKFHIERYKKLSGQTQGLSYVITPSASEIEALDLQNYKIQHIPGTLETFTEWLNKELPDPLTHIDIARKSMPPYALLLDPTSDVKDAALFDSVVQVTRSNIGALKGSQNTRIIRNFYKGFKPTWNDIADNIPAILDAFDDCISFVESHSISAKILPIIGSSGSGKTTLLMQVLYRLSEQTDTHVYYISDPIDNFVKTIKAIKESVNGDSKIIVGIDNLDYFCDSLLEVCKAEWCSNILFIGTERSAIWNRRTNYKLPMSNENIFHIKEFTDADAPKLLDKLEKHGFWTRLGKLSTVDRISELVTRARKQLLIALLEATNGRGYEDIIADEYNSLNTEHEKKFFLLSGLGTIHRIGMPSKLVQRSLANMGILAEYTLLLKNLSGIVFEDNHKLNVRHETYVRYLLANIIEPKLVQETIISLLSAFSLYGFPFAKTAPKLEFSLYKATINHKFLFEVLKGREPLIIDLYKTLEKSYELDGLFLLQYGLALRDLHKHDIALEKLEAACVAYKMDHTEHALAKQLFINGREFKDKIKAYAYLERAKEILQRLDKTINSDDTYPFVTLAEGHTELVMEYEGVEPAKAIAKYYVKELKIRSDRRPTEQRLNDSWQRLFKFASTGSWSSVDNND